VNNKNCFVVINLLLSCQWSDKVKQLFFIRSCLLGQRTLWVVCTNVGPSLIADQRNFKALLQG